MSRLALRLEATETEPVEGFDMFFARVRWIGRVLNEAGIDHNSKTGKELSSTLLTFSKYCEEKHRRGDGSSRMRLDFGPNEWAVFAAIMVPEEYKVTEHLCTTLGISEDAASSLLTIIREAALKLATPKMQAVLAPYVL